jgi:stalled ribosome alternative rescue factor ArfA
MVKRSGKGDYYRKAQNHPEECFLEGQKFVFRARNSAPGENF